MTFSSLFISFDYVITIWYCHLHVLISELIQYKSGLNQRCSALKTQVSQLIKLARNAINSTIRAEKRQNSETTSGILEFQPGYLSSSKTNHLIYKHRQFFHGQFLQHLEWGGLFWFSKQQGGVWEECVDRYRTVIFLQHCFLHEHSNERWLLHR